MEFKSKNIVEIQTKTFDISNAAKLNKCLVMKLKVS